MKNGEKASGENGAMTRRPATMRYATALLLAALLSLGAALTVALVTSEEAKATTGAQVVYEARRHLGVPYLYGACEPFVRESCTCLPKSVYAKFGVSLSLDVSRQYNSGRAVSTADLQPGDLVFFKTTSGIIYHVGIYSRGDYAGEPLMIHASSYFGGVTENRIKYLDGYAGARRLL